MTKDNVLRLIIINENLNEAEMMISAIKSSGYAVRPKHVEEEEALLNCLKSHAPDMVLHSLDTKSIELEQTVSCIRKAGKHVAVIATSSNGASEPIEHMLQGAVDVVARNQQEHLKLVVTRTAQAHFQWKELKKLEAALHESEKRCRMLLDSSRDSICYVHEGMHIYANPTYLDIFGYTDMEEIEGTPIMDMVAPNDQQMMKDFLRNLDHSAKENETLAIKMRHADGNVFDAQMEFSSASIDGEPCTQIVIRDQADAKDLEQQLAYLSERDVATGLFNRKYFMEQLEGAISEATQGERNRALVHIEICNISEIKDTVGVAATDLVLADTARILEGQCHESELLARFGEDSFIILSTQWELDKLKTFTEQLAATIDAHVCDVEGKSISAQACVGASQIDENSPSANEQLVRAEKSVLQARMQEKTRVVIYTPKEGEMSQKQRDSAWESTLRAALAEERLKLQFQPIVSLHGDPGERYEVVLHVLDEQGDSIPAEEFLPSAERTGVAVELDRWLIRSAIKHLAEVRQSGNDTIFFIKLTTGLVQDAESLPWLGEELRNSRVPPASLVFELKEEVIVTYFKQAKSLVKGLKDMHCHFAIDDFGTGLNPFQLVKAMPTDFLRIDKSLMGEISTNSENQEAVRTITDTAHSMNRVSIAPYVEDAAALSVLWGIGVNYIQGNFLQEPSGETDYDFSTME